MISRCLYLIAVVLLCVSCHLTPEPNQPQCANEPSKMEIVWQKDGINTPIAPFKENVLCYNTDAGRLNSINATTGDLVWSVSLSPGQFDLRGDTLLCRDFFSQGFKFLNANDGSKFFEINLSTNEFLVSKTANYLVVSKFSTDFTSTDIGVYSRHDGSYRVFYTLTQNGGTFATSLSQGMAFETTAVGELLVLNFYKFVFDTQVSENKWIAFRLNDASVLWEKNIANSQFWNMNFNIDNTLIATGSSNTYKINLVNGTGTGITYSNFIPQWQANSADYTFLHDGINLHVFRNSDATELWMKPVFNPITEINPNHFIDNNGRIYLVGAIDINSAAQYRWLFTFDSANGNILSTDRAPDFFMDCRTGYQDILYHPQSNQLIAADDKHTYAFKLPQ